MESVFTLNPTDSPKLLLLLSYQCNLWIVLTSFLFLHFICFSDSWQFEFNQFLLIEVNKIFFPHPSSSILLIYQSCIFSLILHLAFSIPCLIIFILSCVSFLAFFMNHRFFTLLTIYYFLLIFLFFWNSFRTYFSFIIFLAADKMLQLLNLYSLEYVLAWSKCVI